MPTSSTSSSSSSSSDSSIEAKQNEDPPKIKRRVKVYMLSSARQWDDKGTGYIETIKVNRPIDKVYIKGLPKTAKKDKDEDKKDEKLLDVENDVDDEEEENQTKNEVQTENNDKENSCPNPEKAAKTSQDSDEEFEDALTDQPDNKPEEPKTMPTIQMTVTSEDSPFTGLLDTIVYLDQPYHKQQETLIVWTEPDENDLALSFEEKPACEAIWAQICEIQNKDPSCEVTIEVEGDPYVTDPEPENPEPRNEKTANNYFNDEPLDPEEEDPGDYFSPMHTAYNTPRTLR